MAQQFYIYVHTTYSNNVNSAANFQPGSYCLCCLDRNVPFINLGTCYHRGFFDIIAKFKIEFSEMAICYSCHYILKRFDKFKQQAEESLTVLSGQVQYLPSKSKFRLERSTINITDSALKIEEEPSIEDYESLIEGACIGAEQPPVIDLQDFVSSTLKVEFDPSNQSYSTEIKQNDRLPNQPKIANHPEDVDKRRIGMRMDPPNQTIEIKQNDRLPKLQPKITNYPAGLYEERIKMRMDPPNQTIENKQNDRLPKLLPKIANYPPGLYEERIRMRVDLPNQTYSTELKQNPLPNEQPKIENYPKDVYEGRIRMRVYTEDEMLRERENRRKMDSYLKKPFKCEDCVRGFDYELMFKGHIERQHERNKKLNFKCHICKSVLGSEGSYKSHVKGHYTRYECCACGKRATNLLSIEIHYNTVHGDMGTRYYCDDCNFVTNKNNVYRKHKDSCMNKKKKRYECQVCGSSVGTPTALRIHMSTVHGQSSHKFSCTLCDKSYKVSSALATHVASSHSGGKAYCEPCGKEFKNQQNLEVHRKTHANHVAEGRYICDDCGATYRTKYTLVTHLQAEHLNTVVKCKKCPKVYRSTLTLKKHVQRAHEPTKPRPRNKICDHCGKGFTTQAILTCHIRTHTGERPLHCTYCPATFAHKAALYNHKKLVHKHKTKPRVSLEHKTSLKTK